MAGSASIPAAGQLDSFISWRRAEASGGVVSDRCSVGALSLVGCAPPAPAPSSTLSSLPRVAARKGAITLITAAGGESFGRGIIRILASLQQQQQRRRRCHSDAHCSNVRSRSVDRFGDRSGCRSSPCSRGVDCSCFGSSSVDHCAATSRGGSAAALAEASPRGAASCGGVGGRGLLSLGADDSDALSAFQVRVIDNMGGERSMSGQQRETSSDSLDMMATSPDGSSCSSSRDGSSDSGEDEAQHQHLVQPQRLAEKTVPKRWDVLGLGQAMVDFSGIVDDSFLDELELVKGTRKVVNDEERRTILRALEGWDFKLTAGGSLSNTLVALARLGYGYSGDTPLSVAMTGSVGRDVLGDFYRTKLHKAGVHFLAEPVSEGVTGSVIVCTTPDAQRTMLSYQGMSSTVNFDAALKGQISTSRIFVVEGYLWELPETVDTIAAVCKVAKSHGSLVALTASDTSCVARHRKKMWDVITESADILFTNFDEAQSLLGAAESFDMTPGEAAGILSMQCPMVSVTDGAQGSCIGVKGEVIYIEPASCLPVDTCGAGDAYAAGILYGLLRGDPDLKSIGRLAAKVASVVVGQQGPRLKEKDARMLSSSLASISGLLEGLNLDVRKSEQSVNA